jgi:hypothetical protein
MKRSSAHLRPVVVLSGALAALGGCGHDWDPYTPVEPQPSTGTGTGGSAGTGGEATGGVPGTSSTSSGSTASSAGGGGASTSSSVGGGGPCDPAFSDDFSGDLGQWQIDSGTWSIQGGALAQLDPLAGTTLIYVPDVVLGDQRLQATTTMVSGATGGAIELVARIDPDNPGNRYWCAFQPSDGWLVIRAEADYLKLAEPVAFQVDLAQTPGYSATASHVMHFDVVGTTLHCWVEGVVGADATTSDGLYTQGSVGLKTYLKHALFDDFTVCP